MEARGAWVCDLPGLPEETETDTDRRVKNNKEDGNSWEQWLLPEDHESP